MLCLATSITANATPTIGSGPYVYACHAAFSNSSTTIDQFFNVFTQSKSTTSASNQMTSFINQNYPGSTIAFLACEPGPYSEPTPPKEKMCQPPETCGYSDPTVSIPNTYIYFNADPDQGQ